jgi:Ribosomal protein L11 methyltransferase (PrmA)
VSNLAPDMRLHRVPDVRVHIDSSNNVQVLSDHTAYHLGPHGLVVLDAFYRPTTVSEALKKLGGRVTGAQDWIDLTTTLVQLYDAGILRDETQGIPKLERGRLSFGAPDIHVGMLNDRARTSSFLAGIKEVVHPGDVVVDIGTGTGVLAMAAAHAGAKRVYAIEASSIGETAKCIFEVNGVADRITLLQGWSTHLSLPERADVLVSEIIGNEPLGEGVLETTADARKRLLKPQARFVPNRIQIFGLPVTVPDAELAKNMPTAQTLKEWRSWYGIDFGPLAEVARRSSQAFFVRPHKAKSWTAFSEPILLAEVNLKEVERYLIDNSTNVTASCPGELNGLLVYFELDVSPTTRLSTHPEHADANCSWRSMVWVLDPLKLRVGDRFRVSYRYGATETSHSVAVTRSYQ